MAAGNFTFLILTVVVCAYLWRRHRQNRLPVLGEKIANLICLVSFVVMFSRAIASSALARMQLLDVRAPIVGQSLIVLQWTYLLRKKSPRDYGWMYLVTVVHMGIAGLMMPGIGHGVFFLLYAACGICTLMMFNMWHEALGVGGDLVRRKVRLGPRFQISMVAATIVLMLPVAGIFMMLPRPARRLRLAQQFAPGLAQLSVQPVTGFSPTVQLGGIGRLQANPERVMHLTVRNPDTGESRKIDDALLLKGVALDRYERDEAGRWAWSADPSLWRPYGWRGEVNVEEIYASSFPGFRVRNYERIECDISLEPLQALYLFAPFAPESFTLPRDYGLWAHERMHAFSYRTRRRTAGTFRYTVVSRLFPVEQPDEARAIPNVASRIILPYLQLPEELSPEIKILAEGIAPQAECPDDYTKAMRILEYLSDNQRFTYTLTMAATPGAEPVEDFLFTRRSGHCEYFAAAMTLLLREVGIPARVVNGFKVSEWNPIGGYYVVRQSDAHSWVEAYLRPDGWRTFDPSVMRDAATPTPLFLRRWWRNLFGTAENLWVSYVLTYDTEAQAKVYSSVNRLLAPFRWLSARLAATMAKAVGIGRGMTRRNVGLAFMVLVSAMIAAAAAVFFNRKRGSRARSGRSAELRFYRKMERLLGRRGFHRPASQTVWEFHDVLAARNWPAMDAVSLITRGFCDARYGGRSLSVQEKQSLTHALQLIRKTRPSRSRRL